MLAIQCVVLSSLLLSLGCATPRPRVDPLSPVNRSAYALDEFSHDFVFGPLGRGWDAVTPAVVSDALAAFSHNLSTPKLLLADMLQGNLRASADDLSRFLVNTTLGLAGFVDVASRAGIPRHGEDFGQVLCTWRVPVGPYVYFPLLGPSSAAEAVSSTLDLAFAPLDTLLPGIARGSSRTMLLQEIARAAEAADLGVDGYDYQRISYQENRIRHAHDEVGFLPITSAGLAAERAQGTCGYQGARSSRANSAGAG